MSNTEVQAQTEVPPQDAPAQEAHAPATDTPPADAPAEQIDGSPKNDDKKKKPAKVRKQRTPKDKKAKKTPSHPPYFQMIKEAITALSEKGGSSPYAIAKYMEENHKPVLPSNFRKILGLQLKNSVSRGKLMKIKASYKLTEAGKRSTTTTTTTKTRAARANAGAKTKETETKKRKPKSRAVSKIDNSPPSSLPNVPNLGATTRARRSKRAAPASKPKQLKSIKSPAAKKAKKGVTA